MRGNTPKRNLPIEENPEKGLKTMIAIVILNWNGSAMMRKFLPSVVECSRGLGEVIVADNGSDDDSLEMLEREFPQVRLLKFDKNHGFAEGYNVAFAQLHDMSEKGLAPRYGYYLLLNSDVEVTPGWLEPMHDYMETHADCAACQPKVMATYDRSRFEYAGACGGYIDRYGYPFCRGRVFAVTEEDHGQYDDVADIFWATGAALMVRTSDWHVHGGLDGRFFAHNEEIDFCWRLRSRGRRIVCIPQSTVYHVGGGTLPQDNPRKTYLNFRNNLTMLYKNLPEGELQHVMRCRTLLDWVAALQFLAKGDVPNFKAVWRARRDFKAWKHGFDDDRSLNLRLSTPDSIPERCNASLVVNYYLRHRRTFSQIFR